MVTTKGRRRRALKRPRAAWRAVKAVSKCDARAVTLEAMASLSVGERTGLRATIGVAAVIAAARASRSVVTG